MAYFRNKRKRRIIAVESQKSDNNAPIADTLTYSNLFSSTFYGV